MSAWRMSQKLVGGGLLIITGVRLCIKVTFIAQE
jgi:hypothetical protein